jgi:acetyl esterase/lipase
MFVTPDYRNFPQARVPAMAEDVRASIGWVHSINPFIYTILLL